MFNQHERITIFFVLLAIAVECGFAAPKPDDNENGADQVSEKRVLKKLNELNEKLDLQVKNVADTIVNKFWNNWASKNKNMENSSAQLAPLAVADLALDSNLEEKFFAEPATHLYNIVASIGESTKDEINSDNCDSWLNNHITQACKTYHQHFESYFGSSTTTPSDKLLRHVDDKNSLYYNVLASYRLCDLMLENMDKIKHKIINDLTVG